MPISIGLEGIGSILAITVTAIIAGLDGKARKRAEKKTEQEHSAKHVRFMDLIGETLSIDLNFDDWREEAKGWFTPEPWYVSQISPEALRVGQKHFHRTISMVYVSRLQRIANLSVDHWPNPSLYMKFYSAFVFVKDAADSLASYMSDERLDKLSASDYHNPEALVAFNFQLREFNQFGYLKHCVKEFKTLAAREGISSKYFYTDGAIASYIAEDEAAAGEIRRQLDEILGQQSTQENKV